MNDKSKLNYLKIENSIFILILRNSKSLKKRFEELEWCKIVFMTEGSLWILALSKNNELAKALSLSEGQNFFPSLKNFG